MRIRPQPFVQRLSDAMMLVDCLETEKHFAQMFTCAALEAAVPELRSAFEAGWRDSLELAEELFRLMGERGWYPLQPAPPEEVARVAETFAEATDRQVAGHGPGPWQRAPSNHGGVDFPTYAGPLPGGPDGGARGAGGG